jgi:5-methyltetrahydrofolate--homocysteine methyltransferase
MVRSQRVKKLIQRLNERVLVLDGAMGTAIQEKNLTEADFGGAAYEGCNEYLVITKPQVIEDIHQAYLDAGADILETNTFGGTPLVMGEFDLTDQAYKVNLEAAKLARKVADRTSTPTWLFAQGRAYCDKK